MKDWPNAFWAASFILIASIIAVIILFCKAETNVKMGVLTMASSIVTGAFGYIQGKRDASDSVTFPTSPKAATSISVTPPAEPPAPTVNP